MYLYIHVCVLCVWERWKWQMWRDFWNEKTFLTVNLIEFKHLRRTRKWVCPFTCLRLTHDSVSEPTVCVRDAWITPNSSHCASNQPSGCYLNRIEFSDQTFACWISEVCLVYESWQEASCYLASRSSGGKKDAESIHCKDGAGLPGNGKVVWEDPVSVNRRYCVDWVKALHRCLNFLGISGAIDWTKYLFL